MLARCAVALALASVLPTFAQAKDGEDDSGHSIAVAAAGCTELPSAAGAPSARAGGAFTVGGGAAASLICTFPTDELDRSSDSSPKPVTFQIAYLDSDGPGAGLVAVELVSTSLSTDPAGHLDSIVCAWSSAAGGPIVATTASLTCNDGIAEGAFYHLRVGLASAPGSTASFVGVIATR